MVRSRTQSFLTRRYNGDDNSRAPDELIVEEPLLIRLDDTDVSSTMRTPGHDFELAAGFCLAEGVLAGESIVRIRYCGAGSAMENEFNVVTVETGGRAPTPTARLGSITSSCGLCGVEAIGELTERLRQLPSHDAWPIELLLDLPRRAEVEQGLFRTTGAVHGATAFDRSGEIVVTREDIGRHNAVDKVAGRLLLDGRLPATGLALVVSGRASFELVQKAWAAGFTALVSVSAPSALAVNTARRAGLMLVGFTRDGRGNVYSPEHNV
jgi:FdhD protein